MFWLDTGETGLICFGCFGLTDELLHSFTFVFRDGSPAYPDRWQPINEFWPSLP
jgi:hypothetical protein